MTALGDDATVSEILVKCHVTRVGKGLGMGLRRAEKSCRTPHLLMLVP